MEHTPGPWIAGTSDTHEGSAVWGDGGLRGAKQVAICPREFEAHAANAQLIAAAPELLSALSDALDEWRAADHSAGLNPKFKAAEAAIQKANQLRRTP